MCMLFHIFFFSLYLSLFLSFLLGSSSKRFVGALDTFGRFVVICLFAVIVYTNSKNYCITSGKMVFIWINGHESTKMRALSLIQMLQCFNAFGIGMQDDQASAGWLVHTNTSFIQILCGIKMCDYFVP